jgi:mRNA-degrading endonuclease RelE of RelBE toxin-antitoxin system
LHLLQTLKRIESSSPADELGFKRIQGTPGPDFYRLRVGSYRVLCTVEPNVVTILRIITRQDLEKAIRQLTGR